MTQYVYEMDMGAERDYWLKKCQAARVELAHMKVRANKFDAALTDACAARDALAAELAQAREELRQRQESQAYTDGILRKTQDELLEALAQTRADVAEVSAENARLATDYQDDADAVCVALGVEWTDGNRYPTVALEAIAQAHEELAASAQQKEELIRIRWELRDVRSANRALGARFRKRLATLDAAEKALAHAETDHKRWFGIAQEQAWQLAGEYDKRQEAEQRAARAEALSALVTPELANLLVLLASSADTSVQYHRCTAIAEDAKAARKLAAQIREALDDKA